MRERERAGRVWLLLPAVEVTFEELAAAPIRALRAGGATPSPPGTTAA
jgi:hypothetical protein